MRDSKILKKVRAGRPARLALLGHYMPEYIAYAAHAGYDGIWQDLEHRPMNPREVQSLMAFCHLYDIDCMLRPSTREKAALYRYYEDGASGLMIPHVNTPEEAADLVRKVKFPPLGDRGIEGFGFDNNYSLDAPSLNDLVQYAHRETFLIVQIETPQAMDNLEKIAAIPGVDALYVGTADYGIRTPHIPEEQRLTRPQIMERVSAVCRKNQKMWGQFTLVEEELAMQMKLGANLIAYGFDLVMLREGLKTTGEVLQRLEEENFKAM